MVVVDVDPSVGLEPEQVARAISAHVAELGFDVATTQQATSAGSTRVALSQTQSGDVRVEIRRPGNRVFVREIPDRSDPDLLLETLGVVVRGALAPVSMPENETPAGPPAAASSTSPPEPPSQLDVSAAYRGDSFARRQPWHSGLHLGLTWESRRGAIVGVGAGWVPPHRGRAELQVQRIPVELSVGWRARAGRRVRPSVEALVAAEAVGWSGARPGSEARPGWAPRIGAGIGVGLTVELGAGVFGWSRLSGRGWPLGAELIERGPDGPRELLRAFPVSGEVLVGVGYHLFFIRNRRRAPTIPTNP